MIPWGLIQVVVTRLAIGIIALLALFGFGSTPENALPRKQDTPATTETEYVESGTATLTPEESPRKKENIVSSKEKPADIEPTPPLPEIQIPTSEETVIETPHITPATEIPLSFSHINTETAKALVNILCSQNIAGAVTPITGSGVIIDPRGIVITNAHVAQYFLLKDYPKKDGLSCIVRTGSPARATYTAELLYIPSTWVTLHVSDITNSEPVGTGEYDYAFLRITGRTDPSAELPETFQFVPLDRHDENIISGDSVLASAYPAGFLGGVTIQRDLYAVSSIATVGERYTFTQNDVDLISIGGTVVSQGGSSGGAVVSRENKLIGIIVTSSKGDTTAERDLRAVTIGHVNRSLIEQTNTTLEGLLSGDIALTSKLFNNNVAPILTSLYLQKLVR